MERIVAALHHVANVHGAEASALVLQQWPVPSATEEFLGVAVFALATSAVQGRSFEEKEVAVVALEGCLSLASSALDPAAVERLQASVVERVLRNFDAAGDALAAKASQGLLMPGSSVAQTTEPLRALAALLLRCTGASGLPADQLLELARGDAALVVAVIAEAVRDEPVGLPQWSLGLMQALHQLTTPDAFVALLRLTDPDRDFGGVAMADLADRQLEHSRALALSLVQFDLLDRALLAAERKEQRQPVVVLLVRTLHNLTAGKRLVEPGRLLSRWLALDFQRFGFRFLTPLVRKLIAESHTQEVARLLRHVCRTLSWLLVHAEFDGSALLAESLRPVASEWALRGLSAAPPGVLAALLVLAGNCGGLEGRLLGEAEGAVHKVYEDVSMELWRCPALTELGESGLASLGFDVSPALREDAGGEADESGDMSPCSPVFHGDFVAGPDGWLDARWFADEGDSDDEETGEGEGVVCLDYARDCRECGNCVLRGVIGEGYFDGMWYCVRCWNGWEEAGSGAAISPWPLDCGSAVPREQRGATATLLKAPGHLRCGVSGRLLVEQATQVPASCTTAYPVLFARQSLEKWHRRSGGRCPLTGQPLDMREALDAPHILQEVRSLLSVEAPAFY